GFYNPLATEKETKLQVNLERVQYWLSKGAKPSDRVAELLKRATKS
ncbi:MAG: 30S ribosomal protein S16, partial [Gammaproteobacteria bacterium]|nr:30S ribosomal protein S16 [Gammaproteobacteria bacterium]